MRAGDFGDMWEKLDSSRLMLHIFNRSLVDRPETDVAPLIQLAYAIMRGLPLIVVAAEGDEIPEKLLRVADEVVRVPDFRSAAGEFSEETKEKLVAVLRRLGLAPEPGPPTTPATAVVSYLMDGAHRFTRHRDGCRHLERARAAVAENETRQKWGGPPELPGGFVGLRVWDDEVVMERLFPGARARVRDCLVCRPGAAP